MAQYKVHIIETTENIEINRLTGDPAFDTLEYLVVAGGGGGGAGKAAPAAGGSGGGGAGGLLLGNILLVSANVGTHAVTIGGGGGGANPTGRGGNGSNSSILGISTTGGGGGGGYNSANWSGNPGGSGGGGGSGGPDGPAITTAGSGVSGQGNPGGAGLASYDAYNNRSGGGGGGAGGAGQLAFGPGGPGGSTSGGAAGAGLLVNITGTDTYYANGGSGAHFPVVEPQLPFTGKGGRAGRDGTYPGYAGDSGTIIIRYPVIIPTFLPRISSVIDVATAANTYYGDQTVTMQVTTANVVSNETLYYSVNNASNSQVVGGNTGSFIITSNNYVEVPVTLNISGTSNITMQVRRNSGTGALLGESENVTIAERLISGGTITEDELYVTHAFTTSGNLVISSDVSGTVVSNILIVAGGGGAGPVYFGYWVGGGGGGGGGLIEKPDHTLYPGNTYSIIVGAGGSESTPGDNSSAFGMIALGGGGGTGTVNPNGPAPGNAGLQGGSGGGGGGASSPLYDGPEGAGIQTTSPSIPADSRTYGYGFPGRKAQGGNAYGGGGGSAAGTSTSPDSSLGFNGKPISWVPDSYGTPGLASPAPLSNPAPGRYFAGGANGSKNGETGSPTSAGRFYAGGTGNARSPLYGGSTAGVAFTGGGGAAGSGLGTPATGVKAPYVEGKAGGSGIVIIRYPK